MKRILSCLFFACLVSVIAALGFGAQKHSYMPAGGYVPNAETAIRIAEAVWIPIYGKEKMEGEKPFHAGLKNGVWTVIGTLPKGKPGGVAIAEIAKKDGRILRVTHGR